MVNSVSLKNEAAFYRTRMWQLEVRLALLALWSIDKRACGGPFERAIRARWCLAKKARKTLLEQQAGGLRTK